MHVQCARMKPMAFTALLATLLLPTTDTDAQVLQLSAKVGHTYEVTLSRESSRHGSDGSSGSTQDRDTFVERVIGLREGGIEVEYDLPRAISAEEMAGNWQFPARVLKSPGVPMQLLNRSELEARVASWLKKAKLTRAACGHLIFTWNAFRIECDPQSVIHTVELLEFGSPDLRSGALYQDAKAHGRGRLSSRETEPDGTSFTAMMEVDPDAVRRQRAESDVDVAELTSKALSIDAAMRERAKESISGTVAVTFDMDSAGQIRRRTRVTRLEIEKPDGQLETETITETLQRRLVS